MSKIKNIIFDLGGVLLQIDYQKTEDAFVALGITNFAEYYKQDFVSMLFEDFEIGKISANDFCDGIRKISKRNLTNVQIEIAWNAMLLSFWEDRLVWLEEMSKHYKIYLFSNTNEIHYNAVLEIYNKTYSTKTFSSYFIKDYYSHILGMRKPYKESYLEVLEAENLQANETLFIDDTFKNIEGAKQAELKVLLLLPNMNLQNKVNDFLEEFI